MVVARNIVETDGGGWLEKDTKTHQSRCIALDAATLAVLQDHRARLDERADTIGTTPMTDGYLFSRQADGSVPWMPNHQSQRFKQLCRRVGLDWIRLHDYADLRVMPIRRGMSWSPGFSGLRASA
ncbi:MAG: hypothetical protein ACRD0U_00825 [Acidimicrobiales bacterium]